MSNYRVKIQINDYFPKIDAIPYDDFICLISCNNYYSRIKLTEYQSQQFKFDLKIIRNTDLLFNIKLINYLDNNKLVGMYNLIIPHNKVNQILQRDISLYKQQIKLIMNSNIKIKLFGIMMNITNIYLDLIFQISAINEGTAIRPNQINKMKLYEMLGNNSYAKNYNKNKKKVKSNNNSMTDCKRSNNININLSKSPIINYNNFMYDFKENEANKGKQYSNSNNKNFNNINNQKCSDINFNVMNYNYLNYLKIDNNNNDNNYVSNVKFNINSRSPIIISKNIVDLNNQEIHNKKNIKQNNSTKYFNLINKNYLNDYSNIKTKEKENNYNDKQNVSTKKKGKNKEIQLYINPVLQNNVDELNFNELNKYKKNTRPKYLTDAKNSMNLDNIINNSHEMTEVNEKNNKIKYQNLIKDNNNHKISYINYINKNNNILYDKKNHLNKFIHNNKVSKKTQNPNKHNKVEKEKQITKTQVFRNKMEISEFNESQTHDSKMKTPRNFIEYNINTKNNNVAIPFNESTIKKRTETKMTINTNENDNLNQLSDKIENKVINTFLYDVNDFTNEKEKEGKIIEIKENINFDIQNDDKKNIENKENINIVPNENISPNKEEKEKELILNPEEFKNKIINSFKENQNLKKEIISQIYKNREYTKKLLLIKEIFYSELKKRNNLTEKTNNSNIKTMIHVNVRGKLNSNIYLNMKHIKSKESNILYKIFYEHKNSPQYKALQAKKKIKEKMEQQKQIHSLLNLIRELITKYENLSQLYNDDEKKKILFKSLLVRYGIREKEEAKENNLVDKFNEIKNKLEEEKKIKIMKVKKREIQEDLYKNVIKEEEDEERSSISDQQYFNRKSSLRNRVSWGSEDSSNKDKDNFESNKSNKDDESNSLLSSGLKRIKESKDEEFFKKDEKENVKEENIKKDEIINNNKEKDIAKDTKEEK